MRADRVFLTGAGGFVGSHILRELLAAGYRVSALVREGAPVPEGADAVRGDLERAGDLVRALDGCRYLVHCAALYSFSPRDRGAMHRVNVVGTETLLAAAHVAGVERAVVTSSSATVGPAQGARLATEADHAPHHGGSNYHDSKSEQELAVVRSRLPSVMILPTAPIGPNDHKPTPTGKMVLDFARGRMVVLPPRGGLNVVAVEDVARAHLAALERGRTGERYLVGGENLTLDAIWEILAETTGRPLPQRRAPSALAFSVAYADELRCRLVPGAQPFAPLEGLRMAHETMFVDDAKARRELGHAPGSVRAAFTRSVAWFREHGYVRHVA